MDFKKPISAKRKIGNDAEMVAVEFLKKNGYKIVEKNFNTRFGEIDVIALDGDTLAFVEVKYRKSADFGNPFDAIGFHKKARLRKTAWCYVKKYGISNADLRFDVVSILDDKIDLLRNAFV